MPKKISDLTAKTTLNNTDSFPLSDTVVGADRRITKENLLDALGGASKSYVDDKTSLSVKQFGAEGNGVANDTSSIKSAITFVKENGGRLYFPEGVYMINETLYIPSSLTLFGEGKTKSIIKAISGTLFERVTPLSFTGMQEKYNYRSMISTESADESSAVSNVDDVSVSHIGIDWNDCPGGDYSISPIIAGRCTNVHFNDIKLFGALASDLPDQSTTRFHGFCILFAFAEDCSINDSFIEYADYESVAVRYLSKRISSYRNTYFIDKPQTISGNQSHHTQLARPTHLKDELEVQFGESKPGPYFCDENKFINVRGSNSIATSHTGKGFYCRGNYVKTLPASFNYLSYVFKPFDGTEDFEIGGNIIDLTEGGIGFNDTINTDDKSANNFPVENGVVENNKIYLRLNRTDHPSLADRGVFSGKNNDDKNITYRNNKIILTEYNNQPYNIFRIRGLSNKVVGNEVVLGNASEPITSDGLTIIQTWSINDFEFSRNKAYGGDIGNGILLATAADLSNGIIDGNNFRTSKGVVIDNITPSQARLINNIGIDNHNDIETGVFTPEFKIGGVAQDLSTKSGTYKKHGNRVNFEISFFKSSYVKEGSGDVTISGLPFTSSSNPTGGFGGITLFNNYSGVFSFGEVVAGTAEIAIKKEGANQNTKVTDADISSGGTFILRLTGTYRV